MLNNNVLYSLRDVNLEPTIVSDIDSRSWCNPYCDSIERNVTNSMFLPIIAAPMDSVVSEDNWKLFWGNRLSCVIPRTVPIGERLVLSHSVFCAFSQDEVRCFFLTDGKVDDNSMHYVLIDVANGHMKSQLELGREIKRKYGDKVLLMGGNIANPETYLEYCVCGFDYVRVGIGGGDGCLSSTNTGVHYPMASLLDKINGLKKPTCKVIADGGITGYSDVIKCLALGADYVMLGSVLNKAVESAGKTTYGNFYTKSGVLRPILTAIMKGREVKQITPTLVDRMKNGRVELFKNYRGMSTKAVQKIILENSHRTATSLKTSEGREKQNKVCYTLSGWADNMNSYLRSAMSYCGVRSLDEFKGKININVVSSNTSAKINDK